MPDKEFTIAPMFHEKIKENGFTFCGVFDNTGETPNFVYSINLTEKLGAELVVLSNLPIDPMYAILHSFIEVTKGLPVEGMHVSDAMMVSVDGDNKPLRLYVKEVTGETWLDDVVLNRCPKFNKVYQIYFADKYNGLPTDDGNTDPHKQIQNTNTTQNV